jgi:dephospho-CoA kinase
MLCRMTFVLGLSGGIGSGKSSVSALLLELGAALVDADAIVHELQGPGQPMLAELARQFGDGVLDESGALDRAALGAIVFSDAAKRALLGKIMHPPVIAEMMRRTQAAVDAGVSMAVVDIPLLFEGAKVGQGAAAVMNFDATLLVWVPPEIQAERTMKRDGTDREEVMRRINAQLPIDEKKAMADYVIDNSGTPEATRRQVEALFSRLTADETTR